MDLLAQGSPEKKTTQQHIQDSLPRDFYRMPKVFSDAKKIKSSSYWELQNRYWPWRQSVDRSIGPKTEKNPWILILKPSEPRRQRRQFRLLPCNKIHVRKGVRRLENEVEVRTLRRKTLTYKELLQKTSSLLFFYNCSQT